MKMRVGGAGSVVAIAAVLAALLVVTGCVELERAEAGGDRETPQSAVDPTAVRGGPAEGEATSTRPDEEGSITIRGVGSFRFDSRRVETVREDIFRNGHFSVFDILVHLDRTGSIDLSYSFDENMNTHVIRSIDGEGPWWYRIYYEGGWPEDNNFRMDHYPYKDRAFVTLFQPKPERLSEIHEVFREETARAARTGATGADDQAEVVVPRITIRSWGDVVTVEDVPVQAHDLRSDALQPGTVTAMDVILSLGDRGELTYDIIWMERIGFAEVQNYFVERINKDARMGRCGFVYEAGPEDYRGFRGNHIHLPSDMRVIYAPEYVEFFWICV